MLVPKLTTSRITFWKLVKVGKLQTLKLSSRIIASLKAILDAYLNQSLSICKAWKVEDIKLLINELGVSL